MESRWKVTTRGTKVGGDFLAVCKLCARVVLFKDKMTLELDCVKGCEGKWQKRLEEEAKERKATATPTAHLFDRTNDRTLFD